MKVAVTFPGCHRRGGVERVVYECVRYLAGRGHQVDVYANEWEAENFDNVRYIRVPVTKRPSFLGPRSFFKECSRLLDSAQYDAVSTHGCVSPTAGVQWVHSVHRAWLEHSRIFRGRFSMARLKQRLNPLHPALLRLETFHFADRRYKKVIALTPDVQADLARYYGVPSQDVVTIPNGYSPTEFNLDRVAALRQGVRTELGYTPDDRVIIFVANELERKGFGPLLRAAARLQDRHQLQLLVVGRVKPDNYRAELDRLGMSERVRFVGPSSDVARYYSAADVFVLPTQYEAWGLVIVEAMACGLPVLTSRCAGAAVAVVEGKSGMLLDDPADVEELTAKLGIMLASGCFVPETVAASVAAYTWPNVLQRYENLLLTNTN